MCLETWRCLCPNNMFFKHEFCVEICFSSWHVEMNENIRCILFVKVPKLFPFWCVGPGQPHSMRKFTEKTSTFFRSKTKWKSIHRTAICSERNLKHQTQYSIWCSSMAACGERGKEGKWRTHLNWLWLNGRCICFIFHCFWRTLHAYRIEQRSPYERRLSSRWSIRRSPRRRHCSVEARANTMAT